MIHSQWLIPLLPIASAVLVHLLAGRLGKRVAKLSVAVSTLTVVVALYSLIGYITTQSNPYWASLGGSWGSLILDPLSSIMSLVVAGISLIVHIYSVRYMAEEPGYPRFFMLLDLMTASILLMVSAGDLITLLVAWHLVGVLLYFLLGQNTESWPSQRYAFWTFITYRIGDLPLVLAAVLLYQAYGALDFPTLFARIAENPDATSVLGLPVTATVALMVAFSAFAKSAQFPLHTWLPYTMEGPTPVSALMHAGIVNAGGFIINRFAPVFVHSDGVLHLLFIVGLITALIGSVLMLTQNDIKKSLGYSTMGQMGFMVMECGLGAFSLAVFHLIAHGLFKGTMFLGSGSMIGEARQHDGVPHNPLYTFLVERKSASTKLPWLIIGVVTLVVPLAILVLAHWVVAADFFQKQGAIVLLFFGWITGVQVLFATHRLDASNPIRMMMLILLSFTLIVVGYTFIGHAFENFLYPDEAFRNAIYHTAGIDALTFDGLVVLLALIVIGGWISSYLTTRDESLFGNRFGNLQLTLYSLISREFYVADLYDRMAHTLLDVSKRLNVWLRWY
ncbi:oxidoreductase [Halothiobacillus diazotrophicus]|uniref:Probable inorganic carbon transporter subunit DabB n=1 Tax=Halothiobacillus diazotrophicus TaxID=1860122 RepID=A0A191ZGS1_9GAMM|nr:proton-conducting transporter membrane subunit [Halothiobacillus diazotrophicus]ANJ67053.1 oxidoreductase [Halothiobacillus diazotrophicus]